MGGDELTGARRGRSTVERRCGDVDILRCGAVREVGMVMMEEVVMGMNEDGCVQLWFRQLRIAQCIKLSLSLSQDSSHCRPYP